MKTEQCLYQREGPKAGYRVVAWRRRCRNKVCVANDAAYAYCWRHRPAVQS